MGTALNFNFFTFWDYFQALNDVKISISNSIWPYIYGKTISWTFQKWNKNIEKLKLMMSAKSQSIKKKLKNCWNFCFSNLNCHRKITLTQKPLKFTTIQTIIYPLKKNLTGWKYLVWFLCYDSKRRDQQIENFPMEVNYYIII